MQLDRYSFLGQLGWSAPNDLPTLLGGMAFRMDLSCDEAVTPYAMRGSKYWKYRNDVTGEDGTMDVIHTDLDLERAYDRVARALHVRARHRDTAERGGFHAVWAGPVCDLAFGGGSGAGLVDGAVRMSLLIQQNSH